MTNRISVSNPTQPVISVTDEGGVLVTVNYQNSTGGGGGTGDVVGPASSTDNAIARYDGTTGKLIQDSGITIADGATGTLAGSNSGDVTLGASVTDILAVTGQSISGVDQGSDKLVFWDESENKLTALTAGSGLSISGTTITATATGDVVGPASSTDNALVRFDSTTGKLVQNGQITESDTGDLAAINSLAFDTTPTGSIAAQGEVMWSADDETLDIKLNGFTMHTGQHVLYHVQNSTGSTISKGAPVMYAGTTGNSGKLLISLWNGTGPSTLFLGLVGEDLANGASGFVVAFGKLRGVQTNGGNYGQTWVDGDIIYAGATSGSLTKTQPAAPNPRIQVCSVVHAHASNGTLFVLRTLGSNIKDDEGVTITSLSSGQLLVANNAGTVFENKSVSGDATLANTGALTLATINSNVGSFGSATAAPAVTVNAKGLVTAVSTNTITPAVGSITGLGTNVATSLANNMSASGTLAILGANTFTGVQTLPAGSVSATSMNFGTAGTGIYTSAAATSLDFAIGAARVFQLNSSGLRLANDTKDTIWRRTDIDMLMLQGTNTPLSTGIGYTVSPGVNLGASGGLRWTNDTPAASPDIILVRDAASILAFRNGVTANCFRIYNTYTSATNYERGVFDWRTTANTLQIGTEKGSGGGTARAMRLVTDATARAVFEATTFNTTLLASAGSYGSGSGVLFLGNATAAPTTDPTGGGILYVEAGALKFRGSSGTVTTIANA